MTALLLIVAAGSGTRLGKPEPKALVPIAGRPILVWSLDALAAGFARTVVTAPPERTADFARLVGGRADVVAGGETRSASVRRGFAALQPADGDILAIHDAARPFVTADESARVVEAAARSGASIAATPIIDTVKRADGCIVRETVDRSQLFAAATPQAFRADVLRRALESGEDATDEAALCERLGIPVTIVAVSRLAFKITTPEDLAIAEAIARGRTR